MAEEPEEPGERQPVEKIPDPGPAAPGSQCPLSPAASALKKLVEENSYDGPEVEGTLETLPAQHDADEDE